MHSSRMRTIRNSSHLLGGAWFGGLLIDGGLLVESGLLLWPSGVMLVCLLVWWPSVMAFWLKGSLLGDLPVPEGLTRRPYQKAITEDHIRRP